MIMKLTAQLFEISKEPFDPCMLSAAELASLIASHRVSSTQVIEAFLHRISKLDPQLHAYVNVHGEAARAAALKADQALASGQAIGPLHGVPIAVKDLIEIEGEVTTGGSAHYQHRRSTFTAPVIRHLIEQGMIILGKTHTVEFAFGGWGTNQHMGTPRNPWDANVHRVPGGSSSGSGVAVAANLAPWALGTDTGGSVRLPASFCGITALKTTAGRIPSYGVMPLSLTLDTVGPMARSVADVALLYSAMLPVPGARPDLARHANVAGMRLGRITESERDGVDSEVLAAYDHALDLLRGLGAEIVDVEMPFRLWSFGQKTHISRAEAYFFTGHLAEDAAVTMDDDVRRKTLDGKDVSLSEYIEMRARQKKDQADLLAAMTGVDALLTPTTDFPAIAVDDVKPDRPAGRFSRFVNFCELCALALPSGFSSSGLPLSLQIVCRGLDEDTALRVGSAYQNATDWHQRAPIRSLSLD